MHEVVAGEENECGCFGPVSIVWLLRSCSERGVTEIFGYVWSPTHRCGRRDFYDICYVVFVRRSQFVLRFLLIKKKQVQFPVSVSICFAGTKNLGSM